MPGHKHFNAVTVVHVAGEHLPAIGCIARGDVFLHGHVGGTVDTNAVLIVEHDELAELEGSCEARGFRRNALHEAAFTDKRVGVVINRGKIRRVELRREHGLGNGHADRRRNTLTERAGRHFHAGGVPVLGVSGTGGSDLTEIPDIVERHGISGKMQNGIQQH